MAYHVFCMKEPYYVMKLMTTYGTLERMNKRTRRKFKCGGIMHTKEFMSTEMVVVVVSGLQAECHVQIMRRWSSNLEQWTIQRPRLWVTSPYSLRPTRRSKPVFQ